MLRDITVAFAKKHATELVGLLDGYAASDDTGKAASEKKIAELTDRLSTLASGHRLPLDDRAMRAGGERIGNIPS